MATPIGHLEDLSPRAARTLREADIVAAEDTRVTRVLLRHAGSGARLVSARAHNEAEVAREIVEWIAQGRAVALVSDAGTPAISDPGARVVAAVREAGWPVTPIPGPSALAALLSVAGLPEGPVLFEGFLPARAKARRERLGALAAAAGPIGACLVFYEAPHRIDELFADLVQVFGEARPLVIGRELTKVYEEVACLPAGEALAWLAQRPERRRGEFVLAVGADPAAGTTPDAPGDAVTIDASTRRLLRLLLSALPASRAARLAHEFTGLPREALYALATAGRETAEPDADANA